MMWQYLLLSALAAAPTAHAIVEQYYTTNAVCKQKYCVNPVFPGLDQLGSMEKMRWKKFDLEKTVQHLSFCKDYVDYDFALPVVDYSKVWNFTTHTLSDQVQAQEADAAKLFFFHVSAMGLDAWDYPKPEETSAMPMSDCVRAIARMACFTYLPQANPNLQQGMETRYLKPCKSSCENYVKECNVECCDDSVQCVFSRPSKEVSSAVTRGLVEPSSLVQVDAGYADYNGPCAQCTGGAQSQHTIAGWAGMALLLLLCVSF